MRKTISTELWDAELNTDVCDPYTNADVTLILKLGFRQINPANGAAGGTYNDYGDTGAPARRIIRWTPAAWTKWTRDLVGSAQDYWHGRFWLVNNFPTLEYEAKGTRYRANVYCRLRILQADVPPIGPVDAHHVIDVVRLHPAETWFGSHSTLYDSRDTRWVQKNKDSRNRPIMQRAHVHEIGHLLGLGHVDVGKPHCPKSGDTNATACYGIADADLQNVMGAGMARTRNLAQPWRRAIVQLTGLGNADDASDWRSDTIRHYPRTQAEATAGRAITARPAR